MRQGGRYGSKSWNPVFYQGKKMVIAANFRKYPEAMALQFPLRLGKPRWHTSRPTTRLGRAVRAAIGRAVKAAAALTWAARLELAKIGKKPAPQWVKDAQRRARALGVWVREAMMALDFDQADRKQAALVVLKKLQADREAWAIAQDCKATHAAQARQAAINGEALRSGTKKIAQSVHQVMG